MTRKTNARIAGGLWLIVIIAGMSALLIRSSLIVRGDAAATAANIMLAEPLYRLGFAADVVAFACYMGLTVILYELLKPVNTTISMLAAFFGLAGCAVGAVILVGLLVPLVVLGGAPYLSALDPDELQALALSSLRLHGQAYDITGVFFGLQCILVGYLIVRSTFIPPLLGVLLATGGLSYVVSAFASFLSPSFGAHLSPYIVPAGLVGEGSLCLWLIAKGLDLRRWQAQQ